MNVLLIDDDEVDREAVHRLLDNGYTVRDADGAKAGLALIDEVAPDCVLLDYRLPDADGLSLVGEFVARRIPVVMMTSQGNEAIAVEAMKRGAKDYLVKGQISAEGLASSIRFAIEQQRAQSAVDESETNVRAIFEAALDCIIAIDAEGRIVDFNFAAETTFGYRRDEVIGRLMYDVLFPDELRERAQKNIKRFLANQETGSMLGRRLELPAKRKNGKTFIAEMAIQPIPLRGEAVLALFLHDITQRKKAEKTLKDVQKVLIERVAERTAELRTANAKLESEMAERQQANEQLQMHRYELYHVARLSTMGEMASGIAHELNQPLTAIVGYVETCLELLRQNGVGDESLTDDLENAVKQARRAGEIIKRLRALVRKREGQRSAVDLNEAVQSAVALTAPDAKQRGVVVECSLVDSAVNVQADRIQIEQVLLNLIRNAMDAMRDVDIAVVTISTEFDSRGGTIHVSDVGCGLPQDSLEKMFDPFFTKKPDGLGLGLSISRSIIEDHAGRISGSANDKRGLTVSVWLPA